jgi:hypothetical protein
LGETEYLELMVNLVQILDRNVQYHHTGERMGTACSVSRVNSVQILDHIAQYHRKVVWKGRAYWVSRACWVRPLDRNGQYHHTREWIESGQSDRELMNC